MSLPIRLREEGNQGLFYYEKEGTILAKMIFRRDLPNRIVIEHTEVDSSLQGQGVGRILLAEIVKWASETGTEVGAECLYVLGQVQKDPTLAQVIN